MATVPAEQDHRAMAEVFTWLGDIIDGFDKHAQAYSVRYWLYLTSDAPNPKPPTELHPALAKAIREEVTQQAHLDKAIRRFVR